MYLSYRPANMQLASNVQADSSLVLAYCAGVDAKTDSPGGAGSRVVEGW